MEARCPACSTRTTVEDDQVAGKTARLRCHACETVWLVSGEVPTAKRAAVVRTGADREHRDLFASRPADLGSVKQTLRPAPPELGGVAARNETSVLFTVDALRGAARVTTPQPEATPMTSGFRMDAEDGIIDLKALASSPPPGRTVAPLFSEPPPAAFAADVSDAFGGGSSANDGFRFGKRTIAGIAAAAVAVVLCSVGLAAAFRGEQPVARVAANALVAPTTAPPVVVTAPPAAPTPAIASASDSASSSDGAKTPAVGVGAGKKGKAGKAGGAKASFSPTKVQSSGVVSKKSDPVSRAPKAADKCGCKGDFTCVLRCTATGK
jgi:predicted Zn finger-like uncharacterized protein